MNKQIIEEAAEWFVELSMGEADQATKSAFDQWLRKSPEHMRIYLEILPIWDDGAIENPESDISAEELIALARASDNVVLMKGESRPGSHAVSDSGAPAAKSIGGMMRRHRRLALAASVAVAVLLSAWGVWFEAYRLPTYATDLGTHRIVALSDGSTVELNTRSRIRVNFTPRAREVELLEGQALFRVAKDKLRPFTVNSDSTSVRAVGTQFDVYRKNGRTTVTVVEGQVAVHHAAGPLLPRIEEVVSIHKASPLSGGNGAVLVSAGEQVTLTTTAPPKPILADVATATAWTQGRLIFEATPLTEVAEEFNRYNERKVVIEDATLSDFLVNGTFRSTDPTSLKRFLQEQPALSVHETANDIRISHR